MTGPRERLLPEHESHPPVSRQSCCRKQRIKIMAACAVLLIAVVALVVAGVSTAATTKDYAYEKDPVYWHNLAQEELENTLKDQQRGVAKNVILFLGDGMGPTTVTAARILAGQQEGKKGEEHKLSFDNFPYTGLSRTYNTDHQTTDSAASGTAYLTGVKANQGTLGLNGAATRWNCASAKGNHVDSILRWSLAAGKSVGVVTTTRITHATPAAAYSHSADRDWESDRLMPPSERACEDIALQLITRNQDINVIMGGGRAYFLPENAVDPDPQPWFNTSRVSRLDQRDLVKEWQTDKQNKNLKHKYVYNKAGFDDVNVLETDYLLGLFAQSHMDFELDRDPTKQPSIVEMTDKAIGILKKNSKGFFLLVEGGRIDHGHHMGQPAYALSDAVKLAEAVDMGAKLTDPSDTLIVVTADHSHVMAIAGYADRGNPILGVSNEHGQIRLESVMDGLPYTTILYGNGPGFTPVRPNLTNVDTQAKEYKSQSAVPMMSETHGGEDVSIFAKGPQSFLYTGVHEQNYIPMVMAYASCVGPYAEGQKPCAKYQSAPNSDNRSTVTKNHGMKVQSSVLLSMFACVVYTIMK